MPSFPLIFPTTLEAMGGGLFWSWQQPYWGCWYLRASCKSGYRVTPSRDAGPWGTVRERIRKEPWGAASTVWAGPVTEKSKGWDGVSGGWGAIKYLTVSEVHTEDLRVGNKKEPFQRFQTKNYRAQRNIWRKMTQWEKRIHFLAPSLITLHGHICTQAVCPGGPQATHMTWAWLWGVPPGGSSENAKHIGQPFGGQTGKSFTTQSRRVPD